MSAPIACAVRGPAFVHPDGRCRCFYGGSAPEHLRTPVASDGPVSADDAATSVTAVRHNHLTRDIKQDGSCPACARYVDEVAP